MTDDASARREEWARLREERAVLRGALVSHLGVLEARARDPFGLKDKIRRHPIVATALAAGVGAILIRLVLPPPPDAPRGGRDGARGRPSDDTSPVMDGIRAALMRVAGPWIARFVEEHLGDLGIDVAELLGAAAPTTQNVPSAQGMSAAQDAQTVPPPESTAPPDVPIA